MSKKIQIQEWRFPPYDSVKKRLQEAGIGIFDKIQSRKSWKKAILEKASVSNDKTRAYGGKSKRKLRAN